MTKEELHDKFCNTNPIRLLTHPTTTLNHFNQIGLLLTIGISCTFKCDDCSNINWKDNEFYKYYRLEKLLYLYYKNNLATSIIMAGLEPFDNTIDVFSFIKAFRLYYDNTIVIYTGYEEEELKDRLNEFKGYENILIKFGRYKKELPKKYDKNLGITLISSNQYSKYIDEL